MNGRDGFIASVRPASDWPCFWSPVWLRRLDLPPPPPASPSGAAARGRAGAIAAGLGAHDDLGALAQLVGAVDHDAIAGLQAREHLDAVAVA